MPGGLLMIDHKSAMVNMVVIIDIKTVPIGITFLVLKPEYSRLIRSLPWLLIFWPDAAQRQQQLCAGEASPCFRRFRVPMPPQCCEMRKKYDSNMLTCGPSLWGWMSVTGASFNIDTIFPDLGTSTVKMIRPFDGLNVIIESVIILYTGACYHIIILKGPLVTSYNWRRHDTPVTWMQCIKTM